jgi:hypothetical protein
MNHFFIINDTEKTADGHPKVFDDHKHLFRRGDWHEENGVITAAIHFPDDGHLELFHKHPKVELIGHILSREPIRDDHAEKLKIHGVKKGHSTFDVAMALKKKHPLMGPSVY